MFDTIPNGVNFPTQATYDDDPDLTQLMTGWDLHQSSMICTDLKEDTATHCPMGMFDPMNPIYVNMSEKSSMGHRNRKYAELAHSLPHNKDQRFCKNCQSPDIYPETEFR